MSDLFFLARVFAGLHAGRNNTLTALRSLISEQQMGQNFFKYRGKTICIYLNSPQQITDRPHDFNDIKNVVRGRIYEAEKRGAAALIMALQPKGSQRLVEHFREIYGERLHLAYLPVHPISAEWDDTMQRLNAVKINRIIDRPLETAKVLLREWQPHLDSLRN